MWVPHCGSHVSEQADIKTSIKADGALMRLGRTSAVEGSVHSVSGYPNFKHSEILSKCRTRLSLLDRCNDSSSEHDDRGNHLTQNPMLDSNSWHRKLLPVMNLHIASTLPTLNKPKVNNFADPPQ